MMHVLLHTVRPSGFISYNVVQRLLQLFNLGDFARINKEKTNNNIIHEPCVDHGDADKHDTGVVPSMTLV